MVALALAACTSPAPSEIAEVVAAESTTQPPDLVDLKVYYRHGRGENAYLTPVTREVPVGDDLPRTALRLLLDGPSGDDDELTAPLPASTQILALEVEDQTAVVDLSRDVVEDAGAVGIRSEHEYLALAAIANTLTEFPAISRVKLRVGGRADRAFWGGWGTPPVLLRDDSVVDPMEPGRPSVPNLANFSARRQRLGSKRHSIPVLAAVRARPRAGYLRVTLDIAADGGGPLFGPIPRTEARRRGKHVVLTTAARATNAVIGDLTQTFDDPAFRSASLRPRGRRDRVVLRITPVRRGGFYLHTSTRPRRVILDIRR